MSYLYLNLKLNVNPVSGLIKAKYRLKRYFLLAPNQNMKLNKTTEYFLLMICDMSYIFLRQNWLIKLISEEILCKFLLVSMFHIWLKYADKTAVNLPGFNCRPLMS